MVHCGYEPSAALGVNAKLGDSFKMLSWVSCGEAGEAVKPALVTGASGFLGWHVARICWSAVTRCARWCGSGSRCANWKSSRSRAICGILSRCERAVAGAALVFHVAADYRLWARDPGELYRSNVDGTRNLLEAARRGRRGAGGLHEHRGLHRGSARTASATKTQPVALDEMTGAYKRSKFLAEQVALEFARDGFPVVIVNPTAPVGDHDFKPTPTGKIVVDFLKGDMPAFIDTGLNVVDVRDTARGAFAGLRTRQAGRAIHSGLRESDAGADSGEAGADHETASARRCGCLMRWRSVPEVCSTAWAQVTGRQPRVPLDAVRMARKKMWVSHEKARRELGSSPGPADGALARAVEWFRRAA